MELGPLSPIGVSAELAGARLKAAIGPCAHAEAVPVDTLDGETVAWLCPGCDEQLPVDWRSARSLPPFVPDPRLTTRIAE